MAGNTIIHKGDPIRKEANAGAAINPGELLAWSSGALIPLDVGTAADTTAPIMVAKENDIVGEGVDDAYGTGEVVHYLVPRRGDELWIYVTGGVDLDVGSVLEAGAAGALAAFTDGKIVAYSLEDRTIATAAGLALVVIA